ncbi:MAG: FABP family protein [Pseudonocardiaceae bacterium]
MNSDVSQPSPHVDAPKIAVEASLPWFDDLPIDMDAVTLGQGVELHPLCQPLAPLVGVWRGEGLAQYPSLLGEFHYGQQVSFTHDGRPFLVYEARAWLLSQTGAVLRPAAREVGWWRMDEDETIEVVLAHMFGICEIYYGGRTGETAWELESDTISRTDTARETTAAARLYGILDNGDLAYAEERALRGLPLQPHLSAQLERIA